MDLLFGGIGKSIPFNCMARQCWLIRPMNIGFVSYNHANFYRFGETSSYWSIKRISVFLCFSLVNQRQLRHHTIILEEGAGNILFIPLSS